MKRKVIWFFSFLALAMVLLALSPLPAATLLNWKQLKVGDGVAGQALLSGGPGVEPSFADPIVSGFDNAPVYTKGSSDGWWTIFRSSDDAITTDSYYTITKAGVPGKSWRITGVSGVVSCIVFWEILVDGTPVYYSGMENACNFTLPTVIKGGDGQSVGLRMKVLGAGVATVLHFTLIGDEE